MDEQNGELGTSIPPAGPGPEGSRAVFCPVYPSTAKYPMQRPPAAEAFWLPARSCLWSL